MRAILKNLKERYSINILEAENPFEMLIRTILSQNTNDKNRDRAFYKMKDFFQELTAEKLANAQLQEIEDAIKVAGLHKVKSVRILEISKYILENLGGKIENILKSPFEEARKELMQLKGVGFKTADILMLFYCNYPIIPVDTHITRVTKRLGFVDLSAKYEKIRENLEELITKDYSNYKEAHLLLIELGRDTCKAIKPKCTICVVERLCPKLIELKVKKQIKKRSKKIAKARNELEKEP